MNKRSIRHAFLQKRALLTSSEAEALTNLITRRTSLFLQKQHIKTVHIFLPQKDRMEVNTWNIISMVRAEYASITITAPRVIPGTREMLHYKLDESTTFVENKWKIPEPDPKRAETILPPEIDLVFVPLLAFDKEGYRVGYGGGYYDRFLAQCRPDAVKAGLSFFEEIEAIDDRDEFDIPMDYCITPYQVREWF